MYKIIHNKTELFFFAKFTRWIMDQLVNMVCLFFILVVFPLDGKTSDLFPWFFRTVYPTT